MGAAERIIGEPESDEQLVWKARVVSGCARQFEDAASFIPILIAAIVIGLGILILQFWVANWNPPPVQAILAILSFVAVPTVAFRWWIKGRYSADSADIKCIVQSDALDIVALKHGIISREIPWHRICRIRSRQFYATTRVIQLTFRHDDRGDVETLEFVLCTDNRGFETFMDILRERISIGPFT